MFRSSASLMAEDVTVRCRVRKLPSNSVNGDGSPANGINTSKSPGKISDDVVSSTPTMIEMTCTMRNWDSNFDGKSSSNRNRSGTYQHQQSSSRNMLLRNAFSLSTSDLQMAANGTSEPSNVFLSDSSLDLPLRDATTSNQDGPELLFTPTYDASPSKATRVHASRRISPASLQPYSIPVNEILRVEYNIANNSVHDLSQTRLLITTLSLGHYDMDCLTTNGHDIVLAFLQASLPQERFVKDESTCTSKSKSSQSPQKTMNQSIKKSKRKSNHSLKNRNEHDADEIPSVHSTNSSVASSCFDIDALQAKHLAGRAEAETWYEKIQRRYGLVVSNILEQFDTCCNNNTTTKTEPSELAAATTEGTAQLNESTANISPSSASRARKRSLSNGITGCLYGELEIDDNATDCSILNSSPPRFSHRQLKVPAAAKLSPLLPMHDRNPHHTNTGSSQQQQQQQQRSKQNMYQQQEHIRIAHMPSGLSVEPEPFDTESVR